jgi:glycosyltransferase involved in cell wall biosynthesis
MKISVVLAVYNDATHIGATLDSILAQTESDFELIAVDDGSTDATPEILESYSSSDKRIRVITQSNTGLTRALIRGCAEARADLIARHDSGDLSYPDRFRRQLALFREDVVLVACTTEFVGPEMEPLYEVKVDPEKTRRSLLSDDAKHLHGISSHGSAMFSRTAYQTAGGYREAFQLAQDLDLWVRLARIGRFDSDQGEPLYRYRVEPRSLTTVNHDRQNELKNIIVALREGGDEKTLLAKAASVRPRKSKSGRAKAPGLYFIGRCLRKRRDPRARKYFAKAVAHNPFHLRAWVSLLTGR